MRGINPWWTLLVLSMSGPGAAADQYFRDCESALSIPAFQPLHAVLDRSNEVRDPASCTALAPPHEYVVITSDQIHYCHTTDKPGCVIDTDGVYYSNLSVLRQFSGARNKQYVLLSAVNMRKGVTGSGYHIFQLVPKSKNPRGYVVYSLGVGEYYGEEADPCAELPAEAEATVIKSVDILHEGTKTVTLAFTEDVTNCSTGVAGVRTLTFSVVDGLFKPAAGKVRQ